MSVPGIVQSRLDGEQVAAEVSLGGEDGLYVTRTRTLIYRGDGLLSDESVEEYPHDAERIEISEGRRKSAIRLDYGIDGTEKFKVPSNRLYEALHPVLAGVLNAAGVTRPEETVKQTYQFSELTLVITSERVVKHVGAAVWDEDYEEYRFEDVTALDVEKGSVSSQIIVESDGRPQRIKTPSDQTREVRERIERALLEYHGASSYEEFARERADDEDDSEGEVERDAEADAGSDEEADPLATGGVDPIDADPPELDDDGAIVEDEGSVTTDDRPGGDGMSPAEASEAAAKAAEASADSGNATTAETTETTEGAESAGVAQSGAPARAGNDGAATTGDTGGATRTADAGRTSGQAGGGETAGRADASDASSATEQTDAGPSTDPKTDDPRLDAEGAESAQATDDSEDGGADRDADAEDEVGGGFADSGFQPASSELERDATDEQLAALTEAVERQNELLAKQQRTIQQLIEELRRGR